jgi:SEFIR domain-containing protein
MTAPKTFISYSWSSPDHQQWVLDLATQLRENGVDVIFDKWDLKEGDDAIAFMERIITDESIGKVVVVSDRMYAEKADGRKGGVGTETQIITPHIYKKVRDQNKFVCVISETDAEGKAYVPTYYQSRMHIDLSKTDIFAENFEQLLRWIFNKPAYPKPQIGKPPTFLDEKAVLLPTRSRAKRAIDLLQKGSDLSGSALADYLETLSDSLENLRLDGSVEPFDQAVVDSVDAFLPYRDEFLHVVSVLARHNPNSQHMVAVKRFIERALIYCFPSSTMPSYNSRSFDNYKFIVHELFLHTVAILIKNEKFSCVDELVRGGLYLGNLQQFSHEPMQGFFVLNQEQSSLDEVRNQRLALRRTSVRADMLNGRSKGAAVDFEQLMQADFVLFLRDAADAAARGSHNRWFPVTLVYASNRSRPFEIFARGRSASYFRQTAPMLGVAGPADLMALIGRFGKGDGFFLPRWNYSSLSVSELSDADKLGTVI